MIGKEFATRFAVDWMAAWNARDLPRILAHYSDDVDMTSPYIAQLMGEPSGTLKGKAAAGDYWRCALARAPDLHFELLDTLVGVDSLVLHYRGARGLAAEVFLFNEDGLVTKAGAHYAA
jgi:hypothetical protein